jgi:biopolymer transport protein ExbD
LSKFNIGARAMAAAPKINVTPLIDVLLVLLIIFMVIQPQKEAKLPVKAPQPETREVGPAEMLMLTVSSDFRLELNSKRLEIDQLLPLLSNLMERRPLEERTLLIRAPKSFAYGPVVLLIDLAKGAGVVTVGLVQDWS